MDYNVYCEACDQVFQPAYKSPLWWRAKKRADNGFLDALRVSNCGCVPKVQSPESPFRVMGYNFAGEMFNIPCWTFVEAIKTFLRHKSDFAIIKGVSTRVAMRLY